MHDARGDKGGGDTGLSIRIAYDIGDLAQHRTAWQQLVRRALEPNFFYEPSAFLAAVNNIPLPGPLHVLLIYAGTAGPSEPDTELLGFFPFYRAKIARVGAGDELRLYRHLHCFLCTPIVDRLRAPQVVDGVLEWFARNPLGVSCVKMSKIRFDGPFGEILRARLAARRLPYRIARRYRRALFRRSADPRDFLRASVSEKRRKELRRLRNRLRDQGQVSLRESGQMDSPDLWAEQFLALESSGWKGASHGGAALANNRDHKRFFRQLVREAQSAGGLMMLSLDLNGVPIAQKCSFRSSGSQEAAFAFKIAHHEGYQRFSPGVQLEIENIMVLHRSVPPIEWMDSCALPNHPMIDHIWRDRREIADVVCGSSSRLNRVLFPIISRLGEQT